MAINYLVALVSGAAGGTVTYNSGMEWWQVLLVTIAPTILTVIFQFTARLISYILQKKGIITEDQAKDIIIKVDKNTTKEDENKEVKK